MIDCTIRHINRMLKGYKEQGKAYFIHGNRGRKPANTIPDETRNLVVDLYRNKYYDANFEHFTELLDKHEDIRISPSAVMSILEAECILSPKATNAKKKRIKEQLKADKKAAKTQKEADQIQTNLVALEDAHPRRPRAAYFGELQQMDALTAYGIPYKFFTDRRTVFTYKKKNSPSIDEDTYTQFAYACKQLGVELEASSAISVPVVISFQSRFPASAF